MSLIVTNEICYYLNLPIKSFKNRDAERIFGGEYSRKLPIEIQRRARMKLLQLDSAVVIGDLKLPPSNRLHRLRGDRKGQYSLSINDQFRICFVWKDGNAHEIEITDYH